MVTTLITTVVLAVIVSALCSVSEAALYSIPISQVEVQARAGKRSSLLLKSLKNDIQRPIVALLTLNTIANTVGAAVAGASAVAVFGEQYLALFSVAFTLVILLFSEILPKTAGVIYSRQLSSIIALPLQGLVHLLAPVIWLCNALIRLVMGQDKQTIVSAEEIQAIAALGRKSGEIDTQQERVITNILDLASKTVRQVMTPRTVTFVLHEALTVVEALRHREKWDLHSRVPVYDEDLDDMVGMVMRKDVFLCAAEDKDKTTLGALMQPVHFVPETAPLDKVFLEFIKCSIHLFVVVDEYGGFTGVISLEDIIEEIMGQEISDETDKTTDMRELARQRRRRLTASADPLAR